MRKLLMGTTAWISFLGLASLPADAAEGGIQLRLQGYLENFFGVGKVDDDGNDFNETMLFSDGEVFFKGATTLDNGLTFGADIQLESFSTGDQIDENYAWVERKDLGRLQLGSENSAAYLRQVVAPEVGVPINSGWITSFIPKPAGHAAGARNPGLTTKLDIGNDENTLTYFTPRLYGFELGLSYVPNVQGGGDGSNAPADIDTAYHDGVSVALSYRLEQNIDHPLGLRATIGYVRASAPEGDIVATSAGGATTIIERPDPQAVLGGLEIAVGGWTFAGSASAQFDGVVTPSLGGQGLGGQGLGALQAVLVNGATSTRGWSWDLGVSYQSGRWRFAASQFHGEVEGDLATGDNDRLQAFLGGIDYAVGPGITASLSGLLASWDGEDGADNSGLVGVAGLKFVF